MPRELVVIGIIALRQCRLSGAALVIAVDPIPLCRKLAKELGAGVVLDPTTMDAGLEIRQLTDQLGVDVALEASGNSAATYRMIGEHPATCIKLGVRLAH